MKDIDSERAEPSCLCPEDPGEAFGGLQVGKGRHHHHRQPEGDAHQENFHAAEKDHGRTLQIATGRAGTGDMFSFSTMKKRLEH